MYKIFIVEDDWAMAEAMGERLTAWGHQVCFAANFQDVLGDFLACQPHLVLMDIMLPFYNGYHWCTELRRVSDVPVMFISSG